ncbi:MAG TPA: HrpE/YscL family type III secretion apparatus protein [Trinickia sp.]
MKFTARRISLSYGEEASPHQLVYSGEEVARLRDVAAVVDRARRAAFAIVGQARENARRLDERATRARQVREREVELALVARARALEELYQIAQSTLTAQLETTLDEVLAAALARAGAEVPAPRRLSIVCEQLRRVAGSGPAARLRLCEADVPYYLDACNGSPPAFPWPAEIDDSLAPGHCKLITALGEWTLDFDSLMACLAAAARDAMPPPIERNSAALPSIPIMAR